MQFNRLAWLLAWPTNLSAALGQSLNESLITTRADRVGRLGWRLKRQRGDFLEARGQSVTVSSVLADWPVLAA